MLSHSKAPKALQVAGYKHTKKTRGLLLWHPTSVEFSSRNNFANPSFFLQKFLSSIIYNSLVSGCICWKLWRYRVAVVSQLPLNGSLLL